MLWVKIVHGARAKLWFFSPASEAIKMQTSEAPDQDPSARLCLPTEVNPLAPGARFLPFLAPPPAQHQLPALGGPESAWRQVGVGLGRKPSFFVGSSEVMTVAGGAGRRSVLSAERSHPRPASHSRAGTVPCTHGLQEGPAQRPETPGA